MEGNTERSRIERASNNLWSLFDCLAARVINRPSSMLSNISKPFQSMIISRAGFNIPNTLISNNRRQLREFASRATGCIFKSVSSERSIVAKVDDAFLDRIRDGNPIPIQLQELISGIDLRIHVIGRNVFTTAIYHNSVDYRDQSKGRPIVRAVDSIPEVLSELCIAITARLGLEFSGIDMRIREDGQIYCFEVNPCPGYSYFEVAAIQPISHAVANLLCSSLNE